MRSRMVRPSTARSSSGPEEAPGLTPAEFEAETADALPERAVMSTLGVPALDPASGSLEGVGDGVPGDHAATAEPPAPGEDTTHAPSETTPMAPEPAHAPPGEPSHASSEPMTAAGTDSHPGHAG